jgi:hypothetical protein
MLRSHRESYHRNGITDLDPLQQTSATKSVKSRPGWPYVGLPLYPESGRGSGRALCPFCAKQTCSSVDLDWWSAADDGNHRPQFVAVCKCRASGGAQSRAFSNACRITFSSLLVNCEGPRLKVSLSIFPVNWNGSL